MEYFGSLYDVNPRDVVAGTPPESILGLVMDDILPEDIFATDPEEDMSNDDIKEEEIIANDFNLAASSPEEAADNVLDEEEESDFDQDSPSPVSSTESLASDSSGSDSLPIFEEVPFFTDSTTLDVKEEIVGDNDPNEAVILPPTVYSDKIRHTSDTSSSTDDEMSPPAAALLEDLEPLMSKESKKPRMSYAQLIAEALMNATDRRLTLNDIYVHINARHPYYSLKGGKGWQNAIRHNLTLNKSFVKVPRPANEGRGSYWELEVGAEKAIFKRLLRQHYMYKVALDAKMSINRRQKPSKLPLSTKPPTKPQIKIIKSIPIVTSAAPKVSAAVNSSSSSKPTIIYVTLPKHLLK